MFGYNNSLFLRGSTSTSSRRVDINKDLKYIKIHCNLVDRSNNINESGHKDDTIISLPIVSTQSLFGTVSQYTDIESKVRIDKGVINNIRFHITDQSHTPISIGKVLLELYIV